MEKDRFVRRPLAALIISLLALASVPSPAAEAHMPPIHHVFLVVLGERFAGSGFGAGSTNAYLSHALPAQGALLESYYAIGHWGLDNYIALVSGQGPNLATQRDCMEVSDFRLHAPGLDSHGQALGFGCIYPTLVKTLPDQLEKAGLSWKGYMDDLGTDPERDQPVTCSVDKIGRQDLTRIPNGDDSYAAIQNPFVYFHGIIDDAKGCKSHIVGLDELNTDLRHVATTPNFAFIAPSTCHEAWSRYCGTTKAPAGTFIAAFLQQWVPLITHSPAFRKDGLLIITFAQSDGSAPHDYDACCGEQGMSVNPEKAGLRGPGGGKVGAVALSPFIRPGTVSTVPYNHYSLLRTVEDIFGLGHLGFAAESGLRPLDSDVFFQ
jgi:phosphatidylinositol-3-phosphatase